MPQKRLRITDPSDPNYVFQAIRENIYNCGLITAEEIMVIAHFLASRHGVRLTLKDVSSVIFQLKELQPRLKTAQIAIRRIPSGFYSEDVEVFFGRLCGGGFAGLEDGGIRLNDNGLKFYQELIGEFFNDEPLVFIELARLIWQIMYPKFFKAPLI